MSSADPQPDTITLTADPPPTDTGYAADKWAFDAEVARVFDDMLWRSIPGFTSMRALVSAMAIPHISPDAVVVDLGCSRGGAIAALIAAAPVQPSAYVGIEVSPPMVDAARSRFGTVDPVLIENVDLRTNWPDTVPERTAGVVLAVLTLQFIPVEHRARVVRRAYNALHPGGAMVVVEKILGSTSAADEMLVAAYYDHKRASGYSQEDIDRKRLSLEGVLVPQTADANVAMLRAEGFREVECFWRHLNFAGWVAVK